MVNNILNKFTQTKLLARVLSAAVMIPVFLAAIFQGGLFYELMILIISGLIGFEWFKIVKNANNGSKALWYCLGALYSAASLYSLWFIMTAVGYQMVLWICMIVWVTDIGAYFTGIFVGGPKIWPKVSPSKTWSGFAGGIILSLLAHQIAINCFLTQFFHDNIVTSVVIVAITSIVAQAGDFLESAFKRRFGVKDSSNIIPGHGGVMDRVDGLVAAHFCWTVALVIWWSW